MHDLERRSCKWLALCVLAASMACGARSREIVSTSPLLDASTPRTTWPKGLPEESVAPASCSAASCLIVERDSTFCSLDPFAMPERALFASKSRLTVRAGTYPLSGRTSMPELAVRIESRYGSTQLSPSAAANVLHRPGANKPDGSPDQLERVEVRGPYAGPQLSLEKFFLRATRWPHSQFRLGDPEDLFWFYWVQRNILVRIGQESPLFPGQQGQTILYAPCAMRGQKDDVFTFEFSDGSKLELRVRTVNGVRELGYYTGRLFSARGNVLGTPVEVRDDWDLAFFGSTRSWAEPSIPSLAVRTARDAETCGYIFDASAWETPEAVNGYVAHRMNCDETKAERLALRSVSYPERYSLP